LSRQLLSFFPTFSLLVNLLERMTTFPDTYFSWCLSIFINKLEIILNRNHLRSKRPESMTRTRDPTIPFQFIGCMFNGLISICIYRHWFPCVLLILILYCSKWRLLLTCLLSTSFTDGLSSYLPTLINLYVLFTDTAYTSCLPKPLIRLVTEIAYTTCLPKPLIRLVYRFCLNILDFLF